MNNAMPEIKNILYATDLSENARHAFLYAVDLAQRYQAGLTILYVMEKINPAMAAQVEAIIGTGKLNALGKDQQQHLTQTITQNVKNFCNEMESEIPSCTLLVEDIIVTRGYAHEEILSQADRMDAGMIVLGSHGYNAVQEAILGGTARKVVRKSTKPVLVVRLS